MSRATDLAAIMDALARRALEEGKPYEAIVTGSLLDFAMTADYDVAWLADQARWDISELADAPLGPQSMELCVTTSLDFARAWRALADRDEESAQRGFFLDWIGRGHRLPGHPSGSPGPRG